MTRILGIDPGSRTTGYGVVELEKGEYRYIESGALRIRGETLPQRLHAIFDSVSEVLDRCQPDDFAIENEIIFLALSEIKERLDSIDTRIDKLESTAMAQENYMDELRKPPVPKILRISEAAKVLRVSQRKLYYLLKKGVFKR